MVTWLADTLTSTLSRLDGSLGILLAMPLTHSLQMCLLPEEVPLPSSPEASAVRGHQRAVPLSPRVRERMAKKLAARQESLPYGGVAKWRRRSCTASATPELPSGDERYLLSGTSLYCGSYGETSNSSSDCSGRIFSQSHGDHLPCSWKQFPWDHRRTLECQLLAAGLSHWGCLQRLATRFWGCCRNPSIAFSLEQLWVLK